MAILRTIAIVRFAKGHGTENDFVVLPDLDGTLDLTPRLAAALCDRRSGVGADGVLRVVRTAVATKQRWVRAADARDTEWFMDYRNADGSLAEMCGNGIRVFGRWLVEAGHASHRAAIPVATRGGVREVTALDDGMIRVDMGVVRQPEVGEVFVETDQGRWPAAAAFAPNPHAVAFVSGLDEIGSLTTPPRVISDGAFPDGVNVEFVVDRTPRHLALRVHERGSGETRSCGTGVCAAAAVAAKRVRVVGPSSWTVDVPGGRLTVDLDVSTASSATAALTGPAVLVAAGELDHRWLAAHA